MKLISCHIENFGKLRNFDYDFSSGLSEILQENGWGKSTFASFLKAMLYGMPKKGNNKPYAVDRSKYAPWQGGVYGGTITFEHKGEKYKMYRTFGATPERDMFSVIDLSTNKRTSIFTENFGYEIYGVGRDTFEITTYFPQVQTTDKVTDEIRASLSGVNNFQNDLRDFSKAIENIDKKIKILKKEISSYSMQEGNLFQIAKIEKEIEEEENNILKLQDEIEVLEDKRFLLKADYEKAQKDLELKDLFKDEMAELKEKLLAKKSELLAFQIKLQELKRENALRRAKNIYLLSTKKIRDVLYYGAIIICMALLTLFAFEFIYGASSLIKVITVIVMVLDSILIYYCIWANKKGRKGFKQRIDLQSYQEQVTSLKDEIKAIEDVIKAKEEHRPNIEIDHEKQKTSIVHDYTACEKEIVLKKAQIGYILKNIESQSAEKEALSIEQISMQEKKMEVEGRIRLLNLTRDFLTEAKNNLSKRYVAPMQAKFSKMLEQVIKEENQKYSLDVDMNVMVEDATGNKEMEYLSQGYQDLMNICKRFSLIESIFEKEKPIIVLDDPFVNLDDELNKNALKLLKKLAESYQIVYLSCHTSRRLKNA